MGLIRLLLALSVLAAHCGGIFGLTFVGGQIAVQSFYIISGFYMSLILNEKYVGTNNSYKLFISNRFLRLFPIYWAVLLATIITCVGILVLSNRHSFPIFGNYLSHTPNIPSLGYLFLTNTFVFGQDLVLFLGIDAKNGSLYFTSDFKKINLPLYPYLFIPQAWTLGLELTFYLIAPFILKKGIKLILTLITLSFLLRLFIYYFLELQNDPWTYRFFPTEFVFFLLGYISYQFNLAIKTIKSIKNLQLFITFFMVFFIFSYPFLPGLKPVIFHFPCKDFIFLITITIAIPFLISFQKNKKIDAKLGELSYPVYISHMLVFMICKSSPFVLLQSGWVIALITIFFSYLLNNLIASPIEKFRQARLTN